MRKTCTHCNIEKEYGEFHKNKNIKDGYHIICKECRSNLRKSCNYKRINESKECPKCKLKLDHSNFYSDKSSKNGLQTYCKKCQLINTQIYYENGGKFLFFKRLYNDLLRNAKKRNIVVSININDIIDMYNKNNKCFMTGLEMTTIYIPNEGKWKRITNVSVDRIDSKKEYTIDNIQLVCSIVNTMKWDLNQSDFVDICKKIYLYNNN